MFPRMDLSYADPAQPVATAGEKLYDLSVDDLSVHDLSDVGTLLPRVCLVR